MIAVLETKHTTLHFTSHHSTSFHFTSQHFLTLQFTSLHFTALHFTSQHFISQHFLTLQFTSLHSTSLHLTSLHFTSLPLGDCRVENKTHHIVRHPNLISQAFLQHFPPCMLRMLLKVGGCSVCVFDQKLVVRLCPSTPNFPLICSPQQSLLKVPNYKALGHVRAFFCTLLSLAPPLIQTSLSLTLKPCFTVNGEVNPGLIN
jgi:hypothetical protein